MYYNEQTILYYDGQFVKAAEAKMDLYSQSLHYGYAIFEGMRAYTTASGSVRIFKAKAHYDRLQRSAELALMPYRYDNEELIRVSEALLEKNNLKEAYIRPLIFCSPNMTLSKARDTHIMICAWEWGAYLGEGLVRVMTSSYQRPHPQGFRVESKISGHYVNSILATQEARDKGYDEALLLDVNGYVAEGSGANVFYEKDGNLYTPPWGHILPGITRATVIEICRELGIRVYEQLFTTGEMKGGDCAFFCGTAVEVVGFKSLDNAPFKKPWNESLGKLIQEAYRCKVLEKEFKSNVAFA